MANIKFRSFLELMDAMDEAHAAMSEYQTVPKAYRGIVLYKAETHTIRVIGRNPGITVSEIALIQHQTRSASSQLVKSLAAKGLVEQRTSEDNKKERYIHLTHFGEEVYKEHEVRDLESYRKIYDSMYSLSNEDMKKFIGFLEYFTSSIRIDTVENRKKAEEFSSLKNNN